MMIWANRSAVDRFTFFNICQDSTDSLPVLSGGTGYGQMSFIQVCEALQVDVLEAMYHLEEKGIKATDLNENIRVLANRNNFEPSDIINTIRAQSE